MSNNILYDNYIMSGTTEELFLEEMTKVKDATQYTVVNPANVFLMSYHRKTEEVIEGTKDIRCTYYFYKLDRNNLSNLKNFNNRLEEVPYTTIIRNGKENFYANFFNSIATGSGLMLMYWDNNKQLHYNGISQSAILTLCRKADAVSDRMHHASLFRDIYIADGLLPDYADGSQEAFENNIKIVEDGLKLAIRCKEKMQDKENSKDMGLIVGVFSEIYLEAGADAVLDLYTYLKDNTCCKKGTIKEWKISQAKMEVQIEFPDAAETFKEKYALGEKYIPGIRIVSSDSGTSSLTVQGIVRLDGTNDIAIISEYIRPHRSKNRFKMKDLQKEAKKDFESHMTDFMKKLGNFYKKPVYASKIDTAKEKENNIEATKKIIEKGIKKMIVSKAVGTKRIKLITERMTDNLDKAHPYTWGDIVEILFRLKTHIMEIDKVETLKAITEEYIQKDVGNILSINQ